MISLGSTFRESVSVRKVMGKEETNKEHSGENGVTTEDGDTETVNGSNVKSQLQGQDEDEENDKELCDIWRQAVSQSQTPATIVICAQVSQRCN